MEQKRVVIIGAGPSGSVAAALLKQQGIDALILERSSFPRFSIGESLLPACMRVLEKAGLVDAVNQAGFQFKNGAAFRRNGKYTAFDFTDKFSPGPGTTYQVQRANFDKVLADESAAQGVEIRYRHWLTDISFADGKALLSVATQAGTDYQIEADFVLDASGFGRVLPKLLELEQPSCLPGRKAVFTHIKDGIVSAEHPEYDRDKILISVHPDNHDVWYWLIPFSNGSCSLGVVGEPEFFDTYSGDNLDVLKAITFEEPGLAALLDKAEFCNPAGELGGYSANVKSLWGKHFALLGNAGEFLDPVFSSGVTIAMESADLAVSALIRQLEGQNVDWQQEYAEPLMKGVDTFRAYVQGWYSGELQDVIFFDRPDPGIKQKVCSILAGYAWDSDNPFVAQPERRLKTLAQVCNPSA
ncbi:NAD(P)/FAD-dependent oxidoreductase [Shewanella corallii]|uniref:NAD(P)/FAD-dependent oxidoreductase n=1 Tax=Shewanella corallii TaxID=560080 RepID=A0ABT0ND98_9GAMM|nr:NAD(P)/FAD-dependent oxidoreductase [Shewanella corallii]